MTSVYEPITSQQDAPGHYWLLFASEPISSLFSKGARDLNNRVAAIHDSVLASRSLQEVIDFLWPQTRIEPLVLATESIIGEPPERYRTRYEYRLSVPYTGIPWLFGYSPTEHDLPPLWGYAPGSDAHNGVLTLGTLANQAAATPEQEKLDADLVQARIQASLRLAQAYVALQTSQIEDQNTKSAAELERLLRERYRQLERARAITKALGFPLQRREETDHVIVAPITQHRIEVANIPALGPHGAEYVLSDDNYREILNVISSMTRVMEYSPNVFSRLSEEDLRFHYLVQLNGQFRGQATGETFNYKGKTDILLRIGSDNVFVAECKVWTGEAAFLDAIDQLLGYLTWRDTKAALIIFSKNKGFSEVIRKAKEAVATHGSYKAGPIEESPTRQRFAFTNPRDPEREITLTVMLFDIPQDSSDS